MRGTRVSSADNLLALHLLESPKLGKPITILHHCTHDGRALRLLTLVDEYTKES